MADPKTTESKPQSAVDILLDAYAREMGFASQKDIPLDQFCALCRAATAFSATLFDRMARQ